MEKIVTLQTEREKGTSELVWNMSADVGSHMVADKRHPLLEMSPRPAGEWRQETRRTQAVIKRLTLYTSIYSNKKLNLTNNF